MRTDIKISVKLNNTNDDSYFDTVSKLLDDLADTIEDSGHEFVMCYSKPDEEDNGFNYDIIDSLNELESISVILKRYGMICRIYDRSEV